MNRFEDLAVWQKARALTRQVYEVSRTGAFAHDFGLRDQMRRAAVSTLSNIAEGYDRPGPNEFLRFLGIAKGSAAELRAQCYVALDAGYITDVQFKELSGRCEEVSRMLAGLMNSISKSNQA